MEARHHEADLLQHDLCRGLLLRRSPHSFGANLHVTKAELGQQPILDGVGAWAPHARIEIALHLDKLLQHGMGIELRAVL
eukprot:3465344-Pyramimonas_sp.AAC.1